MKTAERDLYRSLHPKCANPACPAAFHWTAGGKFFRFRPEADPAAGLTSTRDASQGVHGVKHYWLCERCCHVFTLVSDGQFGIVLRVLWPELPAAEKLHEEVSVA